MTGAGDAVGRDLLRDLYLCDLGSAIHRSYAARLSDPEGRRILADHLRAEEDRARRIARVLETRGLPPATSLRRLFVLCGLAYGRLTALLGTRVMLRIVLSAGERAARGVCAAPEDAASPDLLYLTTLKARSREALVDRLRQHLIDTRPAPPRSPSSRRRPPTRSAPEAGGSSAAPAPAPRDRSPDR